MTSPDVVTVVIVALITVGTGFLLFAEPVARLLAKRRAQVAEVNAVLASRAGHVAPVKLPVTNASRAARASYAKLLKNTDPVEVAKAAERYAAELTDLYDVLVLFPDGVDR